MYSNLQVLFNLDELLDAIVHFLDSIVLSETHPPLV